MTATMMDQIDARARAPELGQGASGGPFHLLPGRLVAYAWLLAVVPIGLLQLVHSDLHEHRELPPVLHWLRDTSLAVPFAAIAVVLAALLVARLRPAEAGERATLMTVALWAGLAAGLFAVLSVPGNQLHGFLFGAEEEAGVGLFQDLATDAVYALAAALLVVIPLALVAGVPWRGARRAASSQPPSNTGAEPSPAATAMPAHINATVTSASTGGDR